MHLEGAPRILILGIALLVATAGAAVDGAVVDVPASKDTTLYENNSPLGNGAGDHFFAGITQSRKIRRGVIAFDLASSIPAGSTVNSVTLTLSALPQAEVAHLHGASGYDVVEGAVDQLGSGFDVATEVCLETGTASHKRALPTNGAAGETRWYLTRPAGGSYDTGGAGPARPGVIVGGGLDRRPVDRAYGRPPLL